MPREEAPHRPMRIRLEGDRRERLERLLDAFLRRELDLELGPLARARLIDFFVKELGAPVYNQAVQDARGFVQAKLDDLEGELYEPFEPGPR